MQTQRNVCVMLELGHRAWLRTEDTPGGDAYDWVVYVRGRETNDIQHFVEKVVFRLHERFPNPKRVCKEPPFQVEETGHGGLLVPIEVHFKNKEPPKKVCFTYDMFVHGEGEPPVKHLRCEKLTFYNPNKDFRRKLLRAGGVLVEPERDDVDRGEGPSEPKAPRKGDSSDR